MPESRSLEDVLDDMHVQLAEELLRRVRSGEATASDLSVARQMLKDNNVTAAPGKSKPLEELGVTLPFQPAASG